MTALPYPAACPAGAVAAMNAGAEDYRRQIPGEHTTPEGYVIAALTYLLSSGYAIVPAPEEAAPTTARAHDRSTP